MSVQILTASENRDSPCQEDIHKETWKVEHVELATELTMLPHPYPWTTEVKAERKEQKVQVPLSSPEELSPVWAAVANRHVSPRYETQSYVGLQLVVKMENYKFSNWECLREFEICQSHDAELCPWHREIWHSTRGSDWRKSNCLLFLPYRAERVLWLTQLPTNKHYKCIYWWKLGSTTANIMH